MEKYCAKSRADVLEKESNYLDKSFATEQSQTGLGIDAYFFTNLETTS